MLLNAAANVLPEPPGLAKAAEVSLADTEQGAVVASGSGIITFAGELRNFSFTLVQKKDGSYQGQAQLINRAQDDVIHIRIDDAAVHGNVVVMTGVITHANKDELVGADALFAIRDNGEGNEATPDDLTLVFFFEPGTVPDPDDLGLPPGDFWMPIEDGNIQVHG